MITVRPTCAADFERLAGEMPSRRVRAWTAEQDGVVLGIGGLMLVEGAYLAFVDLAVEAKRYPFTLHKTARQFLQSVDAEGVKRVVATTDPNSLQMQKWLLRLGFEACGMAGDRALFVRTAC